MSGEFPPRAAAPVPLARARIPLTVIGGFLGAGKTTLLNRILSQVDGLRIAVLVNDFGAVNIDAALVRRRGADTISLANGCVCCQIGDDLTDALIRVMAQPQPPEWIVIEASGVSDPWRIAQVGLADPMLSLDGVVVLADALAIRAQAADARLGETIARQLKAADLIVLSKAEDLPERARADLRQWLRQQAGNVPVLAAVHGDLPLPALTGVAWRGGRAGAQPHRHHAGCGCGEPVSHGELFDTWLLDTAGTVLRAADLHARLNAMPPGVLRVKGVVRTDRYGITELQFAGRRGTLRRLPATPSADMQAAMPADASAHGMVVAIGLRGALPKAALAQLFAQCGADVAGLSKDPALALTDAAAGV
ncbi:MULTISPECIES: CobW family GTP-binding protein [Cupriavidus]